MQGIKEKKQQKAYFKKPTLNSKVGIYLTTKNQGNTKEKSKEIARYSPNTTTKTIEATKSYQELEKKYYKEHLQEVITLNEIAQAQADNIRQDKDKGARNTAIKMAIDYIEPENKEKEEKDNVVVIFK